MEKAIKSVVSMLASKDKVTLFTETGELITITDDDTYDMGKLVEYLTPKLTGLAAVEICLDDYATVKTGLASMDLEAEGIVVTQLINGREVQGIFYPKKGGVTVAVGETKVEIPDVENLKGHIKRAAEDGSPSVINFFKRIAPVIASRRHSGEDLMKFIKHSEMPLTNDGRIIAYKRVKKGATEGTYLDCHSGTIPQRVGSRVSMAVDLVNPDRHQSCSVGLHVANLGYMKSFAGDLTLIVLVNPEDFIAVPHNEYTKARVCSYDIIGVMSGSSHKIINSGAYVRDDLSFEQLIKAAVDGEIPPPFEHVFAGDMKLEKIEPLSEIRPTSIPKTSSKATSGKSLKADVSQPVDVAKVALAAKANGSPEPLPDNVASAFKLLLDGVSKAEVARIHETSTRSIGRWIEKYGNPEDLLKAETAQLPDESSEVSREDLEAAAEKHEELVQAIVQPGSWSNPQQARALFQEWTSKPTPENLSRLRLFKAGKKKSWAALGFTVAEIGQIEKA
jgi:hypothetical protein